jgi:hypothetical protein
LTLQERLPVTVSNPIVRQTTSCPSALFERKVAMKNPWIKKNPLLSIWLSGANAIAGSARGRATTATKRQTRSVMTKGMKQVTDFWTGGLTQAAPKKKKRR